MMPVEKLICIVGPTACGKTRLGVLLAQQFNGEIISVDSMQIYRGMEIGTAAPSRKEQQGIPHHMIAVADPGQDYSVARFVKEADACIQEVLHRGKRPILVGGTGLYLDALVQGRSFAYGESDGSIRQALYSRLQQEGIAPLYQQLQQVDPESAQRLPQADEKRILRALEVYFATGKTITQHNRETAQLPPRYDAVYIGLAYTEREEMKRRIDLRVDEMVRRGLLQEVEHLLQSGVSRSCTAWQAIGFKEFLQVYDGILPLPQAIETVKLRSRQYAKRQLTWLRRNSAIHWIYWDKEQDFQKAMQISTQILTAEGLS